VGVVVAQFLFALGIHGLGALVNAPVVLGLESRDDYLTKTLDVYRVEQKANAIASQGGKIVLFGDTRGFYLDRPYFWGDASHNAIIPYDRLGSPADLARWLRARDVTHAIVNSRFLGRAAWEPPQSSGLVRGAVDEAYFALVYGEPEGAALYRVELKPERPL